MNPPWHAVQNVDEIFSPSLLLYAERVEENIRRMITMAGGVERLRPHIKTHKMASMMRLQLAHGLTKFKCATIAEAEMAAVSGAEDVLLAYPLVGPNVDRFLTLMARFPGVRFSCVADNAHPSASCQTPPRTPERGLKCCSISTSASIARELCLNARSIFTGFSPRDRR